MVGVAAGAYGWLRGAYVGGGVHTPVGGAHTLAEGKVVTRTFSDGRTDGRTRGRP
jgi:hypothetical protein